MYIFPYAYTYACICISPHMNSTRYMSHIHTHICICIHIIHITYSYAYIRIHGWIWKMMPFGETWQSWRSKFPVFLVGEWKSQQKFFEHHRPSEVNFVFKLSVW